MQILVPIRDPNKRQSRKTLERASELAAEHDAQLAVLHINLIHHSKRLSVPELQRAVEDVVGDVETTYLTREGFLVEEIILDEMRSSHTDVLVVGQTRRRWWRRAASRLLGSDRSVDQFLQTQSQVATDIVTVSS